MCSRNMGSEDFYPSILLFIESWLKNGFEDEELKLSSTIRQFVLAIKGSEIIGAKAKEMASLIEIPDCVRHKQNRLSMVTAVQNFRSPGANQGAGPSYDANLLKGHKG